MRFSGFSVEEIILLEQWTQWDIERRQAPPLTGVRGLLVALRIPLRAARSALAMQPHERLLVVGPLLVFDHPAEPFMGNLRREGSPGPQPFRVWLSRSARARWAVAAALVGFLSLRAFYRYLGVGGVTSEAHLAKGLVAFAHTVAVLRKFRSAAVVVTHDLVPRPYFTALAADRVGVPIWMTLLDHQLRTRIPFRLAGLIGYQPHDACGMSPQPPVFVTLPIRSRRTQRQEGEALRGLVLLPHPDSLVLPAAAVTLGALLLEDSRVLRIRIRPHPSHPVDLGALPPKIEIDDSSRLLEDSLDAEDFVVNFAPSSALRTVRRAAIPIFSVDARNLQREALVLRARFDDLSAAETFAALESAESTCLAEAHPDVVDFADFRERAGF